MRTRRVSANANATATTGSARCSQTPSTANPTANATSPSVTERHHLARPPRYDPFMSIAGYRPLPVVPGGPRAFRYRLRRFGPIAGLVPAAVLGGIAFLLLHDNTSTVRGIAGFAATLLAAPALMAFGIPIESASSRLLLGIAASAAMWIVIGLIAALRSTRSPVASWRDFWREYLWLAAGVWLGVGAALLVIEVSLGRLLL